jgi:hypothetical protein
MRALALIRCTDMHPHMHEFMHLTITRYNNKGGKGRVGRKSGGNNAPLFPGNYPPPREGQMRALALIRCTDMHPYMHKSMHLTITHNKGRKRRKGEGRETRGRSARLPVDVITRSSSRGASR